MDIGKEATSLDPQNARSTDNRFALCLLLNLLRMLIAHALPSQHLPTKGIANIRAMPKLASGPYCAMRAAMLCDAQTFDAKSRYAHLSVRT